MKKIIKLFMISLSLTLLILPISVASEKGHGAKAGQHNEGHADSKDTHLKAEEEYVAKILALDLHIQDLLEKRDLLKIHQPAFEAKDFAEALLETRIKHTAHAKHGDKHEDGKMASAVKHIGKAAKLLDKYGDAEDLKKTKSAYKMFKKAINEIKFLYPKVMPSQI